MLGVFSRSCTLSNEGSGLTDHLFLDIKLVAAEVAWYLECLSVVSHTGASRSLTEVTRSGSWLVGLENLSGHNSLQELLLNTSVSYWRGHSCLSVIYITAPLVDVAIGFISLHMFSLKACLVVVFTHVCLCKRFRNQMMILWVLISAQCLFNWGSLQMMCKDICIKSCSKMSLVLDLTELFWLPRMASYVWSPWFSAGTCDE